MKNKILLKITMVALIFCSMFLISACSVQKDVGISSITINSESSVIEVYEGEFNEAGITATVVYEDDTTETITITQDMVRGLNDGPHWVDNPGTYAITVLFKGEMLNLTVKVLPKYITVRFFNGDGCLIEEQSIRKGTDAVAPNDGFGIEGMEFIGWDRLYTNLTEDTDVYAIYGNVTALDIETQLQDWQYVLWGDLYKFYKFNDGKVYYYFGIQGELDEFLYSKDNIQGVEYTAVYTSGINGVGISGGWEISFYTDSNTSNIVYYDNGKLYLEDGLSFNQLNTKYALQKGAWYQWTITEANNETEATYGYIMLTSGTNDDLIIKYYTGSSAPSETSDIINLDYSMDIGDDGNIVITTYETSSIQSLTIVCDTSPYISNLDKTLTIVE